MAKPRILLINPWIYDFAAFNLWARPLGLFTVAEYLSGFAVDLFLVDCLETPGRSKFGTGKYPSELIEKPELLRNVPRYYKRYGIPRQEFTSRLGSYGPFDIVLITSVMAYWYPGLQDAVRLVRETAGHVPIVVGGIYPTLYPEHAARNSGADAVFRGPLDARLPGVLEACGISLPPGGRPSPYYLLRLSSQYPFAPLLTSTGCPYRCSYCASRSLSAGFRQRSIDDVLRAILDLASLGVRDFAFYDDALLHDADRHIKPLLREIVRRRLPVRFHAPNGLHARFLDEEAAHLMKAAGFKTIRVSLETIDPERQQQSGGKVSTSDLERAIRHLRKQKFTKQDVGVYLLYGLPGQGLEEVEEGVRFLQGLNVKIHLAEFSPIRGTGCWDQLVKRGVISDDLDPLLTNNTVFWYLYSDYDRSRVERIRIGVKEYNSSNEPPLC